MYKMNFYLKLIIILFVSIITVVTNNYVILWSFFALIVLIKCKEHMISNLILLIVLLSSYLLSILLIIYKILFILDMLVLFVKTLTFNEKKALQMLFKRNNKSLRISFYEENFDNIVEYNKTKIKELYKDDVSIDDKIESDLERHYLQARIRFYGINNSITFKWTYIDIMILILCIILFILLFILR